MAYNDIKAWREMMDAEEQEKLAYDKACEAAEARAASAEREEYDGIEQTQVDPATMGCRGEDCCCKGGCACLDDLEDDEIDFSAYGIDEADLGVGPADENYPTARDLAREPLVRIPAAAGRPASDADLAAQDVVQLMMEAMKKLQEKKAAEQIDEEREFEESDDELTEEEDAPEKADDKLEQMKQGDDYPLSDEDWDEIDAQADFGKKIKMIQDKVKDRWDALSAEAKRNIRADVDELRKRMLQDRRNQMQWKEALRLQKLSRNRELSAEEKEKFGKIIRNDLTDEQRGKLRNNLYSNGYLISRSGRTARVPASDAQAGNVTDHHTGETAAERSNETGLDSEFDPEKFEYVPEPMQPGTEIPADFNPDFPGMPELKKRAEDDWKKIGNELLPGHKQRKKAWLRKAASDIPDGDEELMRRGNDIEVWKKIVGALDPEEIEEIKQELMKELPGEDHEKKILLKCIFDTFKVTRQDIMAAIGGGGDQKGATGMWTQNTDKLINVLLLALAAYLNICQDPVDIDADGKRKHYDTQTAAFMANLRSENTFQREARKQLRPVFLEEICAELDTDPASVSKELGALPSYSMGRREKTAADKFVMMLFVREWDRSMTAADKNVVRDVFNWYENGTQIRKLNTYLTPEQNAEFQQLIARMRDEGDLPDEDRIRLLQLDIMRRHDQTEQSAHAAAERKYLAMERKGPGEFVEFTTKLAKEFVRGQSTNVTKDTITVPRRVREPVDA